MILQKCQIFEYRLSNVFVLVMEYIRGSGAPECIFHNQHKTLFNLLSPEPAVSCVADKQVSNVKYTYYVAFVAFHLGHCHFCFSHGCVHMHIGYY